MRAVELPDRAAILARAGESLPAWRARVAVARPHLFFTPKSWAGLRARRVSSTGLGRSYFENALAVARQLAAEPAPVYRTPEETMLLDPALKIFEAQQELWMRPIGDSLVALSFALALADDASIRAKLREVVLAVCAWPQWGTLADLASGHVARGIAVACDWHRAIWSEEELALIRTVIRSRMEAMKEAAYGSLYWAGHYDENHNQVGVCGLGLCGLAFLDEIPEAAEWTALALDNFERVARVSNADGTSAEGVPYWSYGTSFIFQFIEGTRHLLDTAGLYSAPAFRHAIAARLHASTPDLSGTVAWGDSPPRDYYGPHHLLFRLAAEHRDSAGQFLGENLPFAPGGFSDVSVWTALWHDPSVASAAPRALDHHAEVGGLVTSRNGWKSGDYLLACKAGFTNRNHSHLDAGALAFCIGSEWLLTTPGYGLGKGEAGFWDKAGRRWKYQSNATESQSTLLIGGRNQRFDFEARGTIDAFETTPEICRFSADLTGAYEGALSARRSVYHRRDEYILVLDEVESAQSETVEWLAQVPVNAETRGHILRIAGAEGSLEIVSISPALQFTLRPPTSLHLDVPADRLKTFALTQYGASARFAVALLPNGKTAPTFTQRDAEILVQGEGWADYLPFPGVPTFLARKKSRNDASPPFCYPLPMTPRMTQLWMRIGCAIVAFALQAQAAPLENNDAQGIKRLNETLTRAGFPAIQVGDGPASVAVTLSPAVAGESSGDHLRSPLSATTAAALGALDEARVAEARGVTEKQVEELREDRGVSLVDILTMPSESLRQAIFEQEREAGDHPEEAMRYEESFKVSEGGRKPTPSDIERARRQAQALPLDTTLLPANLAEARKAGARVSPRSLTSSSWTWKGPGNIGGRIRTMLIHPTQTNRMWIGSVGGGIWYSSDSGASWSAVNDFMSNLAVSTLAMDPTNPNTMYAGTGEGFYNADGIRGAGIYKSTDAGVTWTQLAATANTNFLYVQSIAISPDGTTLLAATSTDIFGTNYLYRSTDGGNSWTVAYPAASRITHVEFNPTDSTKAIASGYSHLALYSTNTGASWTLVTTGPTGGTGYSNGSTSTGGRVEARYARSSPNIVYAAYDFGSASYLYKSTDGGVTYATVNTTGTWLTTQGWYANAIWVSPLDPNLIVVGGLDIYRSTNGGTSFTKISNWQNAPTSAHADHHNILSDPGYNGSSNNLVYFNDDGGIYKATNVSTVSQTSGWTALNNQLGITQFYGAGVNPTTGTIVAGAQDNGTLTYTTAGGPQAWVAMFGGDGGYSAADQSNSSYFYGEYVYLDIHRSTSGGSAGSGSYIYSGITDANSGSTAEFIAPFILDPNNQATLLGGGLSLWRTTNARAGTVSWSAIKSSVGSTITAIAVAPGNSDQIWVGHRSGAIYKTINGTAATPTWTLVNTGLPARRVTRLVVDPNNLSHVYACFGGYSAGNLWSTFNAGTSWTNVTGNLPSAPIYGVAIYPGTSQTLCAGTDVGVFASSDGGATWAGTNVGPTLASTQEIFFNGSNLVAVTHGRGVFTAPISAVDSTPPALTITPTDSSPTDVSPIVFNLTWSENVTGFDATDLQVQGGAVQSFTGSGANYVASVTPSANPGTVTLSVAAGAALDYASNASAAASASVGYNSQSPYLYASGFDGATAPAGWATTGDWQWGGPTSGPGADHTSGSGKLFGTVLAGNYSNSASEYLTTPPFALPSTGLPYKFRFWMWLNSDNGADGGNLEISSNGGTYGVVPSSLLSVPYNSSTLTSMPGGLGWTGTTYAAWTKVRADLSSYAGATVQLRFHFTSDASVNFAGWYIDDAAVELDPITVTLNATDPTATVGSNTGSVAVSLSAPAPVQLSVGYTAGGTAVASRDYTATPSGAATIAPGAQSAVITVNPISGGSRSTRTETVILALANGGTVGVNAGSPSTATVYLAGSVGYDAWRASHFTDAEFADGSISGQNADPDGDGIPNILEYALGLNPKGADTGGLPQPTIVNVSGQNYLSITIARPSSDTDITYVGQVSGDLQSWDGSASAVSTTIQANTPAGFDTVTFRDLTPVGGTAGTKRFLRLNVTQN